MTLPVVMSVPHAGTSVPAGIEKLCALQEADIVRDGDEEAADIYLPAAASCASLVTTDIARAVVDVNRAADDRSRDGVVKTHTCWDVAVYRTYPDEETIQGLLADYYHPYHDKLSRCGAEAGLGIDCHTMAAHGPPVGPDPGAERPAVCLSNADSACPQSWLESLARCFEEAFERPVSVNAPFRGGYIIRRHANECPWVQIELSRAPFCSTADKSQRFISAVETWVRTHI